MNYKIVTIHGIGFNFDEPETFGPSVTKTLQKFGKVFNCHQPLGEDITYENWSKVLDEYQKTTAIDKNTIIVCHSLGTIFTTKYLYENKLSVYGIIYIAGGYSPNIDDFPVYKDFHFSPEAFEYVSNHSEKRVFLYSSKDRFFPLEAQNYFINLSKSKPIFVQGMGHFGRADGVKKIDIIESIMNDIIKK